MTTTIIVIAVVVFFLWPIRSTASRAKFLAQKEVNDRVVVKHCTGDRMAEHMIRQYTAKGYALQNQSTRKAMYSPLTGIFTRKQVHTLTFIKEGR